MKSEEVKTYEYTIPSDIHSGVNGQNVLRELRDLRVSSATLQKLDERGIIKKGEDVHPGDILVAKVKAKTKDEMSENERLFNKMVFDLPERRMTDVSDRAIGYQKGKVIDVRVTPSAGETKVTVRLLSYKPMQEGDKLAGRHGNKGTISRILEDKDMPHTKDGRPVELLFSPLAVPSRKNLGQLFEINAGLVAEKKGLPVYKVNNFDPKERDRLMKELEDIGMPSGKQILMNPKTGKPYENPVTVGPTYIMKLKHKVDGKISQRSIGVVDKANRMPKKVSGAIDGDRHSPQSVGGMEFWSLTSGGAVHNIHEMTTLKSDGAGDTQQRNTIFNAIKKGTTIPAPLTPETVKSLRDQLIGTGFYMAPKRDGKEVPLDEAFSSIMLRPLSRKDRASLGMKEVTDDKGIVARTMDKPAHGLYGESVFGKEGDGWGKITLVHPMPNPFYLSDTNGPRVYEAMLESKGFSNKDLRDIVENGQFVVLDPKNSGLKKYQIISPQEMEDLEDDEKEVEAYTGGLALQKLLAGVDLKHELKEAESRLRGAKGVDKRSLYQKHVRVIGGALDNGLEPEDYLLHEMPVLPVKYREPITSMTGDKTSIEDGITKLYQNLMKQNNQMKDLLDTYKDDSMISPSTRSKMQQSIYERIQNITGQKLYKDPKTEQDFKGIKQRLSSKTGFIREKMQKKPQDYSGRSVIVVDPTLELDQVGLPEDMAKEIFKPHIMKELHERGYTPQEINSHWKNQTQPFRAALEEVASKNPVILNRQPSLHRHSTQAFYPIIRWNEDGRPNRTIGLNAVVTTGFNADCHSVVLMRNR